MPNWKFRLAEPSDAEAFSRWSAENPQIDAADLLAGTKEKNPTVLFFVVEKEGVVVSFAPLYLQFALPHLGFNPEADGKDKLTALQMLIDGVSGIAVQYGLREIVTLSKPEYPVARWALKHGFEMDSRQQFKMDLNHTLEQPGSAEHADEIVAALLAGVKG